MTQTTLIAGLGLVVFGMSTFTPTQRFGILMLVLLIAALIGDLIFLPAILVGPLGKLIAFKEDPAKRERRDQPMVVSTPESFEKLEDPDAVPGSLGKQSTPHSGLKSHQQKKKIDQDGL